ncbi:MAG: polyphosphate polymerase domain-containing protein [Candidatus Izemoplasmatales bacterium]|jgi:hypothetical protein|nr:polyphosphate polymerase domain-containing protein [Candidatus Izemoplasmatales bacterium]
MDLKRTELKYIITFDDYYKLKNELRFLMDLDAHSSIETKDYHIKSLYFDDVYDSHVMEKADGVEFHQKFRIRSYGDENARLEYKTKVGNLTSKQSMWLLNGLENAIMNQNYDFLFRYIKEPLIEQLVVRMKMDHLKPVIWVDYDREAYTYSVGDVRITFDKNIEASIFNRAYPFTRRILEPKTMILEVKYTEILPDFINKVVMHRNFQVLSYSKYYMSWLLLES